MKQSASQRMLKKIVGPMYHCFRRHVFAVNIRYIFAADLGEMPSRNRRQAIVFRFGTAQDIEKLSAERHLYTHQAIEYSRERLQAGDKLVIGCENDDIVFTGWLTFGKLELGNRVFLDISADRVCCYRLHTVADARGRGICPAFYAFLRESMDQVRVTQLLAVVHTANLASRRTHEKSGFRPLGKNYQILLGGKHLNLMWPGLTKRLKRSPFSSCKDSRYRGTTMDSAG